ncbi:MAG: hypothetical protein AVDCRST_MAG12-3304, partial [uncultured Rubrobacteraceae bacterium]
EAPARQGRAARPRLDGRVRGGGRRPALCPRRRGPRRPPHRQHLRARPPGQADDRHPGRGQGDREPGRPRSGDGRKRLRGLGRVRHPQQTLLHERPRLRPPLQRPRVPDRIPRSRASPGLQGLPDPTPRDRPRLRRPETGSRREVPHGHGGLHGRQRRLHKGDRERGPLPGPPSKRGKL